jgi:hypothetical protein
LRVGGQSTQYRSGVGSRPWLMGCPFPTSRRLQTRHPKVGSATLVRVSRQHRVCRSTEETGDGLERYGGASVPFDFLSYHVMNKGGDSAWTYTHRARWRGWARNLARLGANGGSGCCRSSTNCQDRQERLAGFVARYGTAGGKLARLFSRTSTIRDVRITSKSGWPNSRRSPRPIKRSLIMLPPQVDPWMFTNTGSGQYTG